MDVFLGKLGRPQRIKIAVKIIYGLEIRGGNYSSAKFSRFVKSDKVSCEKGRAIELKCCPWLEQRNRLFGNFIEEFNKHSLSFL